MLQTVDQKFQTKAISAKPDVSILDESLFSGVPKIINLLCSVSQKFIALSLIDINEMKFCAFESFQINNILSNEQLAQKLNSLADHSEILKKVNFSKVSVQFVNDHYTFVPSSLFKKDDAENYYLLNHGKVDAAEIGTDVVRSYDITTVFAIPTVIRSGLKGIFEQFNCHHHTTALLEAIALQSRKKEGKNVFVHFSSGMMDVIITEGKKLILCNTFRYKSNEDALYYLLNVCEHTGLNAEQLTMEISGETEKSSALIALLRKYVRNISFSERIKSAKFTYGFDNLPSHYYYSVFSLILTE